MLDMNPFRITITYRHGAVTTFTAGNWEMKKRENELVGLHFASTAPRQAYIRLDDVVSITSARRFPWGLFA